MAKIHTGDLIRRPFKAGEFSTENSGSGQVGVVIPGSIYGAANPDGSGTYLFVSIASINVSTGGSAGSRLSHSFWGRKYGVRILFAPNTGVSVPPFSVAIDGVEHLVAPRVNPVRYSMGLTEGYCEQVIMIDEDLSDTRHEVRYHFPCYNNPASAPTSYWRLYGYVCERRPVFQDMVPHRSVAVASGTLGTSAVVVELGNGVVGQASGLNPFLQADFIGRILYTNSDTTYSRLVTLQLGTQTIWQRVLAPAPAAGTSSSNATPAPGTGQFGSSNAWEAWFDPIKELAATTATTPADGGTPGPHYYQHYADVASKVQFVVFGGK